MEYPETSQITLFIQDEFISNVVTYMICSLGLSKGTVVNSTNLKIVKWVN